MPVLLAPVLLEAELTTRKQARVTDPPQCPGHAGRSLPGTVVRDHSDRSISLDSIQPVLECCS